MGISRSWVVLSLLICACCTTGRLPRAVPDPIKWPLPEQPYQAAIRIWAEKHGQPSDKCVEQTRTTRYRILNDANLAYACGLAEAPAACMETFSYDAERAAVVNLGDNPRGLSYSVRVHELMHVLQWCAGLGEADGEFHTDGIWSLVPPDELPSESPWNWIVVLTVLKDPAPGSAQPAVR